MFKELENDKRTSKIDLGIGIYRDKKGEAPVFSAVKKAETLLLQTEVSKSYKTPSGNSEYCKNILKLVLGKDILNERSNKIGAILDISDKGEHACPYTVLHDAKKTLKRVGGADQALSLIHI